jgi:5-oxoprolinase (ATP-hydrolysing)
MGVGAVIVGPAMIREGLATTIVEPGWQARMLDGGELLLTGARRWRRMAHPMANRPIRSCSNSMPHASWLWRSRWARF